MEEVHAAPSYRRNWDETVVGHNVTNDRPAVLAVFTIFLAFALAALLLTGTLILTRLLTLAAFLMLLLAFILTWLIADLTLAGLLLAGLLLARLLSLLVLLVLLSAATGLSRLIALILIGHEAPLENEPGKPGM
jgi:hypothetical protein